MDQGSKPNQQIVPEKKKIAEVFTQEEFAKLKKDGQRQPMVYQLNTKERSVGENLRHFEITGQKDTVSSSQNSQNRKVIILMGATGSGKSTLINGMINYILGVQWKDPFRFECVREDSSVVRNEAHSQTDSVTAYTLHHREGMTVPYSITLIDTPGYGDTRGIERDKEITSCIHRFLTEQGQGFKIDQIHAICFVAASGNSRLTPTQRYVLDSVLSIFGKDVKKNIRLLVTFADNSTPPVVEACRAAHFPMTSPSAGVMYNQFNSSVLYASNEKKEDSRIKEIMWNMGQRNYKSFFAMLESMNGCDLKSTRQVIRNRQLLEQSLQEIEKELEVCFVTIENLENKSLCGNNSDIKWKSHQDLVEKIKVMSLLDKVNKSDRVLDSGALRSHSPSPDEYFSLIRSRVADEKKPGYEIRLQTLTELQNWFNENNVDEALKSKSANFPLIFPDKSSGHATQRKRSFKHYPTNRAKLPQHNRQNFFDSYLTRPSTAAPNKRSGQEQSTTVRESHNEVRRNEPPIRQSTAGETDTKRNQSTEENSTSVNHDSKIHENLTGCAEDCCYPPTSIANVPIHPKSAENREKRCANALATGNEHTCVEVSSDQNASEFDEENPHSSETSSKKSEQKKFASVSGTVSNWFSSFLSKKS
jgi:GTP-binding protein EngB required for normal cell division